MIQGILLAAGGGRRLGGRPKALLPYKNGLLVEHAARTLHTAGCAEVVVVLGAAADEVVNRANLTNCRIVRNPDWETGMGSSLQKGLSEATGTAALVTLVDMPGVTPEAVRRLLDAHTSKDDLLAATYDGKRSHPVLFGRRWWAGVQKSAHGDVGAREFLKQNAERLRLIECGDVAEPYDIDTPADLSKIKPG